jgi:hypothetical protein
MSDKYLEPTANFNRLLSEYKRYGSITVAYDFDDTIHDYHGTGHTYPLVKQLLKDLKSIDCKLVCWTAYKDLGYVAEFLEKNDLPFDAINDGGIPLPWESKKPFFSALLDDRAGLISMYNDLRLLVNTIKQENESTKETSNN